MGVATREDVWKALYGAIGNDAAWNEFLRVICDHFGAHIGMLVVAGKGQRDRSFYAAHNHREDAARAYSDYWWQHDLTLNAAIERGLFVKGMVARGTQLVPAEEMRASRYFREFLSLMPAEHWMGCVMSDGSDERLAPPMHLSLFRKPGEADFSDPELDRFSAMYPHLCHAFELHWRLRSAEEQLAVFHNSLDGMDFGVVFVDAAQRVRHVNAATRRLAARPEAAAWLGGLPDRLPPGGDLALLLQRCALGEGGVLPLGSGDSRLLALAMPLDAPRRDLAGDTRAAVMLMLIDPSSRPDAALDFVVRAFGLSRAEAKLLPLLFENRTPSEMADMQGVKITTVRSQLSAIFAKTGTSRQQELIRLLGALPAITRVRAER